jgi:hypothetical protein
VIKRLAKQFVDWCLRTEGSTRAVALIRIFLVTVIWGRWAGEVLLYFDLTPQGLALSTSFFVATTLMLFGLFTRVATVWTAAVVLCMYHYFGIELGREPWTHHHTYLLAFSTFLCALTPCGGSYSVDRWLALRRAEKRGEDPPAEVGNLWGMRLIALQLAVIYLFTAANKTHWGFLSGDRMEHYLLYYYFGSEFTRSAFVHAMTMIGAMATVALEYALAFGLLFRRTRKWLVLPGLVLHGVFYVMLPVATYTATMWVLYLAYFEPDAVHRFIDRLSGVGGPAPATPGNTVTPER